MLIDPKVSWTTDGYAVIVRHDNARPIVIFEYDSEADARDALEKIKKIPLTCRVIVHA